MTDKENIRSMESKIQEIERLVAEVVDEYPDGCTWRCRTCCLNDSRPGHIRRAFCEAMHAKHFRIRD